MLILSVTQQPDLVALGMFAVLAVIVLIMALRKRFGAKKAVTEESAPQQAAPDPQPVATAPGSAGEVKLHDVPP